MKCPFCEKEGKKSMLYSDLDAMSHGVTLAGCYPYYDEEGRAHHHDSNISTSYYKCSNGHKLMTKYRSRCCDEWPVIDEITLIEDKLENGR